MNKRIEDYVSKLFANTANESNILDLKEELLANLNEKYNDLTISGKSEDEAFDLITSGIGDIQNLIKEISNTGTNYAERTETLIKSENIELKNTANILIECTKQTLEIRKISGSKLIVSQYGNPNTINQDLFLVSKLDDCIHIYFNKTLNFDILNFYKEKIVVEIPENFIGSLEAKSLSGSVKIEDELTLKNIQLHNSSGGIYINKNTTADTININTSSGKIKINGTVTSNAVYIKTTSGGVHSIMNIKALEKMDLKSSSGKIYFDNDVTSKVLDASTSSGGIHLLNANVDNYNLQSSSGAIKIDRISGGGKVKTTSGSIQLSLFNPKENINLNATSGSIKITLEPSLQFTLVAQSNSGGVHTNFEVNKKKINNSFITNANIGDSPTVNIIANTSSGRISIEELN